MPQDAAGSRARHHRGAEQGSDAGLVVDRLTAPLAGVRFRGNVEHPLAVFEVLPGRVDVRSGRYVQVFDAVAVGEVGALLLVELDAVALGVHAGMTGGTERDQVAKLG